LAALQLGVSAEIELKDGVMLSWGKREKLWALRVHVGGSVEMLQVASRQHRALAAVKMDALLDALFKTLEAELMQVQLANKKLDELLAAFADSKERAT
jgi:hypothetical protein